MRYYEIMTEAFDTQIDYRWNDKSDPDVSLHQAKFSIGDGFFIVQFKKPYYNPGVWELSFVRNYGHDLTGTGSAPQVLATVMRIVRDFIQKHDPRTIVFSAKNDEASRNKLYPKLMRKLMAEFPEYVESEPSKNHKYTRYQVERPPRPIQLPEPEEQKPEKSMTPEEWAEIERFMDEFSREQTAARR